MAASEESLMQVACQEANDSITFSNKDLANRVVDGDRLVSYYLSRNI